jgi:peptidylprolyl isomerase
MLEPAPSELTIKEVFEGTGVEAPAGATVKVHYLGVDYETGEEFDSSWGRGTPIEFPLGRLIKGWQEGIPLISIGGKITLYLPPSLGYGAVAQQNIPANSILIFDIELVSF